LHAIEHPSAQHARVRDVLIAVLLIIGTCIGLLLAHNAETGHSSSNAGSTSIVDVHADGLVAGAEDQAGSTVPFGDSFALCLSIGLGCVTALLLLFLAVRQPPTLEAHAPPMTLEPAPRTGFARVPTVTLNALCISRV
jgi:hypothetical protein